MFNKKLCTEYVGKDWSHILEGLTENANAVASTMGGGGKTVLVYQNGDLTFTKDGVSVSKSIRFGNPAKDAGSLIVISACESTVKNVGDGTTLTAVLLKAFVSQMLDDLATSKFKTLRQLNIAYRKELDKVIAVIGKKVKQVDSVDAIVNIAATSANSKESGEVFREIYEDIGLEAFITLEKAEHARHTVFNITRGVEFSMGYYHSSFMTDKSTEQAIYEDAYVHVEDEVIRRVTPEMDELVSKAKAMDTPVVIIAKDFSDSFLRFASMNKVNNDVPILLIKTPGYGMGVDKNAADIRSLLDDQGFVEKIICTPYTFTLFNTETPFLQDRIDEYMSRAEATEEEYDRLDYTERAKKLQGVCVNMFAGGETPQAKDEEYDRLEDAVLSVRAAKEGGYVRGAGVELFDAAKATTYIQAVLQEPFKTIVTNGNHDLNTILNEVRKGGKGNWGFDVHSGFTANMHKHGIIDPYNVIKYALENAYINAWLIVNSKFCVINAEEKSKE